MIFLLCVLLAAAPSKTNLQTGQYGELIIWTSNFHFLSVIHKWKYFQWTNLLLCCLGSFW